MDANLGHTDTSTASTFRAHFPLPFHSSTFFLSRYNKRYYVPLVLKFLTTECRRWPPRKLSLATSRSFMAEEVKVAAKDWLTICARWFGRKGFMEGALGVIQLGEDHDATTLMAAFATVMSDLSCEENVWMTPTTVVCTFDGAKELISAVARELKRRVLVKGKP